MQIGVRTYAMIQLRVLIQREDDWWVARTLERDLAGQGKDIDDALYELQRVLISHIFLDLEAARTPLSEVPAAPRDCHELWEQGITAVRRPGPWAGPRPLPPVEYDVRFAS